MRPPEAVELEARGQKLGMRMREGKESQRMPRPLPQKMASDGAVHRDRQAQRKGKNLGGEHGRKLMGRTQAGWL